MRQYLLRDIPSGMWREVKAAAARQTVYGRPATIRAIILQALEEWMARQPQDEQAEKSA